MRAFIFALLLGAVLQSWGQKFPGVLPYPPSIAFELPKRAECGLFPQCMTKKNHCGVGRHTLRTFAEVAAKFGDCRAVRVVLIEETQHYADGPMESFEAQSVAELMCKAAKIYGVSIHTAVHPGGVIITFSHKPGDKGTGL